MSIDSQSVCKGIMWCSNMYHIKFLKLRLLRPVFFFFNQKSTGFCKQVHPKQLSIVFSYNINRWGDVLCVPSQSAPIHLLTHCKASLCAMCNFSNLKSNNAVQQQFSRTNTIFKVPTGIHFIYLKTFPLLAFWSVWTQIKSLPN